MIPWDKIEEKYAELFPSNTGMPAKPLRMALGSLIQKQYGYSNEELVEQLRENPYYQYFIGMQGYEDKYPFVPSLLVEFRKRLSEEKLIEVNEIIIASAIPEKDDSDDDNNSNNSDGGNSDIKETEESPEKETKPSNSGTLILDATCAPQNIEYLQDVNLLRMVRKFTKSKAVFPTDDSIRKVIFMSVKEISKKWTMSVRDWGLAYSQFAIFFEDRFAA